MKKVKITERGWGAHFCCADRCLFRRNTLIECGKEKIIVSTVGKLIIDKKIGVEPLHNDGSYFETIVFKACTVNGYVEADVSKQIDEIRTKSDEDSVANDVHDSIVKDVSNKLKEGKL